MNRFIPTLFALVVWLALWGEVSVVNVVSGVLVVGILALLFRPEPRGHTLHLLALARLLAVFAWRLVSSSVTVVLAVLAPTPARLRSGVVGVELSHHSSLVATIVADAISLTPGTLTLEARYADDDASSTSVPPVLYIHVLGLSDPGAIRDDVRRLERLVVSAITPKDPIGTTSDAASGDSAEEGAR
ncbi:MAG TPA: Na+/H+ antiporter subunit E [Ilumatobacteraceae bacterium]|nr:Na+/H+ antiporter subunit E [Ilumatobacteraceae bacterium]